MDLLGDLRLPLMLGTSIAAPGAGLWVTDFLGAAFYARHTDDRDIDDLRLASAILTTRWERKRRRLGARDLPAFVDCFHRMRLARRGGRFGTLDRDALLTGAQRMFGDDFRAAWEDPERRGYGIVFASVDARRAYVPERRLEHAALGPLTPPRRDPADQVWHTYPPVAFELSALDAVLARLRSPARWPDFASSLGRFTPLHSGGLDGQSFEIDVSIDPLAPAPLWTRGYVTVTAALDGDAAGGYCAGLEQQAVPAGGRAIAALELTTHRGHFMGRAISRVIAYERNGRGWLCDVGSWDPMSPLAAGGYRVAGRAAQHRFWSDERPEASMLHQLARAGEAGS